MFSIVRRAFRSRLAIIRRANDRSIFIRAAAWPRLRAHQKTRAQRVDTMTITETSRSEFITLRG
ncbi:hypothetical protein MYF61_28575, partial [Klebsiella quasipneumoniae]|uniref:hypothetical protein n=1 Tax=Klebsiella quasipneumoniae TaxID=1463165 RepID=UPI0020343A6D